jgi:hypothetical protein
MSKLGPDQWRTLSPHLDEALEMTEDQRSTWLSSLQTENPTLTSQLELLLQEHRLLSEKSFLEATPMELSAFPMPSKDWAPSARTGTTPKLQPPAPSETAPASRMRAI